MYDVLRALLVFRPIAQTTMHTAPPYLQILSIEINLKYQNDIYLFVVCLDKNIHYLI